MYKSKFTLSDDTQEFEGYTEGTLWNGWANACFTREQVKAFLDTTPYEYKFEGNRESGELLIWWEPESHSVILSTPLPTDDGDILEGYFLELEFMEVKKNG